MEISVSKHRILEGALKLFSVNGYDATSIEQITNMVGIRKASFYSHFKSKQELLDTLVEEIKERYRAYAHSVINDWNREKTDCLVSASDIAERLAAFVKRQLEFLVNDSFFCMARNFFTIEQFRNPELALIQNKCEYIDAFLFHKVLIKYFVETAVLKDKGIEIMTYELFSPIYVQFYHMQRKPECKKEAMEVVEKHIYHFFEMYSQ